jgi:hypothetical protein
VPITLFNSSGLGEISLAASNQFILFGFYGFSSNNTKEAQFAFFNLSTSTWSQPSPLYNNPIDITATNSSESQELIETDIQVSLHQGSFVLSWIRNRVAVSTKKMHEIARERERVE